MPICTIDIVSAGTQWCKHFHQTSVHKPIKYAEARCCSPPPASRVPCRQPVGPWAACRGPFPSRPGNWMCSGQDSKGHGGIITCHESAWPQMLSFRVRLCPMLEPTMRVLAPQQRCAPFLPSKISVLPAQFILNIFLCAMSLSGEELIAFFRRRTAEPNSQGFSGAGL